MDHWTDPGVVSGLVTGLATVALGVATAVLAVFTKHMADRTSEPFVVATIEPNRWSLMHADIVLSNSGNAPAFDISVVFEPSLPATEGSSDRQLPLQNISVLRPGQTLASYFGEFTPLMGKAYTANVGWRRQPNSSKRETVTYEVNMSTYDGYGHLGASDPLIQIAEEMKKLREDWSSVARGSRRLETNAYLENDRKEEGVHRAESIRRMKARTANLGPHRRSTETSEK